MKNYYFFTLIASAAIMFNASLALADDTLIVTLPGETFVSGTGNTGTPNSQTVGTSFAIKLTAVTAGGTTKDTSYMGAKTVSYTGPSGGVSYVTAVTFSSGASTTTLNTTVTNAQTTTISATEAGALTPVPSSSLLVNPNLVVTLPGQTFNSGSGNSGAVTIQNAGVSFNITLTAVNGDNTIDTGYTGSQPVAYVGPTNSPNGTAPTYTTPVTFTSGQATNLPTTLVDAQTTTINANIGNVVGGTSSSVTVAAPTTATQLGFYPSQTNGGQTGAVWTHQPVVSTEDAYGNVVLGTNQTVTLSIQNNPGSGTLSGVLTAAVNTNTGLATFSGLSINNAGNGYTLTATGTTIDTSAGTIISKPFNIITLTAYDTLVLADGAYCYWPLQETVGPTFYDIGPGGDNGTMYTSTDSGSTVPAGGADDHAAFVIAGTNSTDGGTYSLGGPGPLAGFPGDKAVYFTNLNGALSNSEIVTTYTSNYDTTNFTAEAWINIPTYPVGYTNQFFQIPLTLSDNAGTRAGWYMGVYADREGPSGSTAEGNLFLNLDPAANASFVSVNAATTPGGQWVYAVQGYDGTNFFVYTNGVLRYKVAQTYRSELGYHLQSPGNNRQAPLIMGSLMVTYFGKAGSVQATGFERNAFFHGGISHVAIYPYALTAGQVLTHYNETIPPGTPPFLALQPVGLTNYVGYSPTLSASFAGAGIGYQWYQNLNPLTGQTNQTLHLNNLVASNAGTYYLNATNANGGSNSANAVVVVLPLPADAYQSNVISMLPVGYYPMQETGAAVSGVTPCVDLISYNGLNDNAVYAAFDNATVPTLGDPGPGGSSDIGTGVTLNGSIPNGAVVTNNNNPMDIVGNITMEAWIKVNDYADAQNIIMRGPSVEANPAKTSDYLGFDGFGDYYVGRYQQTFSTNFGYTYAYYGANTLTLPTPTAPASDAGNWVHLVGTADGAAWHLYRNAQEVANFPDSVGAISANGGWAFGARNNMHTPPNNVIFPDCYPGAAPSFGTNGTGLTATINNVALYNYALSPGKILAHYQIGTTGHTSAVTNTLTITPSGSNITLTWNYGTLQEATSVNGPWTDDLAVSPYTVGETNAATFYRAVIK